MQKFNKETKLLASLSLPSLLQAFTVVEKYSCGATYRGQRCETKPSLSKRCGVGVFSWPSGDTYVGEFDDNRRNGKGVQKWTDGSMYCGTFEDDLKHGVGLYSWPNGEVYQGQFFRDRRHGRGEYLWPNGFRFVGTFFMDKKEGYGQFTFTDHAVYQGLYREDERHGPGVFSNNDSRKDDIGFWLREHLVKLCVSVPGVFVIGDHWLLSIDSNAHRLPVAPVTITSRVQPIDSCCLSPPPGVHLMDVRLPADSLAVDRQAFNKAFDAAVNDCSMSWRQHLRQICVGLLMTAPFTFGPNT